MNKNTKIFLLGITMCIACLAACGSSKADTTKAPASGSDKTAATSTPAAATSTPTAAPTDTATPTPTTYANPYTALNEQYGLTADQGTPTADQIETQRKANTLVREKLDYQVKNVFDFFDMDHDGIYEYYIQMGRARIDKSNFNDIYKYVEEDGEGKLVSITNTQFGIYTFGFDKVRTFLIQEYASETGYTQFVYYFLDAYGDQSVVPTPFRNQSKVYADTSDGIYTIVNDDGSTVDIEMSSEEGQQILAEIQKYLMGDYYIPNMNYKGVESTCDTYLPITDDGIINMWDTTYKWNKR